jgi:hypothetical protein
MRLSGTCGGTVGSLSIFLCKPDFSLVGDHSLQLRLVGLIGDHRGMKLILAFARFGRENVPGECVLPDNFSRPGLFKPFGRTFMCL